VKDTQGYFVVHKGEALITNKEDQEIKFLTAHIFYHPRYKKFILLLSSLGCIKHEMIIPLGKEFNDINFPSSAFRCQAIKKYGAEVVEKLIFKNEKIYY